MKVFNESEADVLNFQSWKVGSLVNITYQDLVRILGKPTFNEESDDEKTQVKWVIEFEGNYFTIYDWKTYNRVFTLNRLDEWSVGGSSNPDKLIEFIYSKK